MERHMEHETVQNFDVFQHAGHQNDFNISTNEGSQAKSNTNH